MEKVVFSLLKFGFSRPAAVKKDCQSKRTVNSIFAFNKKLLQDSLPYLNYGQQVFVFQLLNSQALEDPLSNEKEFKLKMSSAQVRQYFWDELESGKTPVLAQSKKLFDVGYGRARRILKETTEEFKSGKKSPENMMKKLDLVADDIVMRARLLEILHWLMESEPTVESLKEVFDEAPEPPMEWWGVKQDLEILTNIYECGFSRDSCKVVIPQEHRSMGINSGQIEHRIKAVLECFLRLKREKLKRARSEAEERGPNKRIPGLSPRQKEILFKMICRFGILEKSSGEVNWKQVVKFFGEELRYVSEVYLQTEYEEIKRKMDSLYNNPSGYDLYKQRFSTLNVNMKSYIRIQWTQLPPKDRSQFNFRAKTNFDEFDSDVDIPQSAHDLTVESATKISHRLNLLSFLREQVIPTIHSTFQRLKQLSPASDLPASWCDQKLIQGLVKYGFDNWRALFADNCFQGTGFSFDELDLKTIGERLKVVLNALKSQKGTEMTSQSSGYGGQFYQQQQMQQQQMQQQQMQQYYQQQFYQYQPFQRGMY